MLQRIQDFKIRYAKETDLVHILRMAKEQIDAILPGSFESSVITGVFETALQNKEFTCIVLVNKEDTPKGLVFACISPLYFSKKIVATCMNIWVDKDVRNQSLDMLKAFEAWAKYKQADILSISSMINLSSEKLGKVFERKGFHKQETIYWKDL